MNKESYSKPTVSAPYAAVHGIKSYFGGKGGSGTYQALINQIPPHHTYVAGFLGHDAIFRMKAPAMDNIGIDISSRVIRAWKQATLYHPLSEKNTWFLEGDFLAMNRNVWDTAGTFLYLDPPYPMETRKSARNRYDYELSTTEHEVLLSKALAANCMVAISSYPNALYDARLKGWRYIDFSSRTRGGTATERLYMNYPEPTELHDYSYLGSDFKEREQIKIKFGRWINNFESLPALEQNMRIQYLSHHKNTGS